MVGANGLTCSLTLTFIGTAGSHSLWLFLNFSSYYFYLFIFGGTAFSWLCSDFSFGQWGQLFVAALGLLITVASFDAEHRL